MKVTRHGFAVSAIEVEHDPPLNSAEGAILKGVTVDGLFFLPGGQVWAEGVPLTPEEFEVFHHLSEMISDRLTTELPPSLQPARRFEVEVEGHDIREALLADVDVIDDSRH
jgi:hypothetical protein